MTKIVKSIFFSFFVNIPFKFKQDGTKHHTVWIIISKDKPVQNDHPDWFFKSKVRQWLCSCQAGSRTNGSCVHVQAALYGATLLGNEKDFFKRSITTLGTDNYKNTIGTQNDDEPSEGEDFSECEFLM